MRSIGADALIDTLGVSDEAINFRETLNEAPSIDIVRCRECKAYDSECEWCGGLGLEMKPDDFCSYGEREGE